MKKALAILLVVLFIGPAIADAPKYQSAGMGELYLGMRKKDPKLKRMQRVGVSNGREHYTLELSFPLLPDIEESHFFFERGRMVRQEHVTKKYEAPASGQCVETMQYRKLKSCS